MIVHVNVDDAVTVQNVIDLTMALQCLEQLVGTVNLATFAFLLSMTRHP